MKKNLKYLFTGAGMLAVCSVLGKLLGAMYRIPLTNVLGGEGMGLYQMVFPLYTLLLTVSSGGLPVAISRIVAVKMSDNDERGAAKVLNVSLVALFVIGLVGSVLLAALSAPLARLQGNGDATMAYLGISPAVLLVAILSCYRGYYQGRENMLPSAASQLIEQVVKLVFGLWFAKALMPKGVAYGVLGALLGVSASELIAVVALMLTYLGTKLKRDKNFVHIKHRRLMTETLGDEGLGDVKRPIQEKPRRSKVRGRGDSIRRVRAFETAAEEAALLDEQISIERSERLRIIAKEREEATERQKKEQAITLGGDSDFAGDMTAELGISAAGAGLQSSCKISGQKDVTTVWEILKSIFKVALPVTFGSLVLPLTQVADSVLIINILTALGVTPAVATMAYGLVSGTVMTLVNMPVVVIFAFSVALLPKIAKACADRQTVAHEAGFSMKLCSCLGLLMFLFMFVYARPIVEVLYAKGLTTDQLELCINLLRLSSFTVFYVSIVQVATAVMQGLDYAKTPAINLAIGALVKIALTAGLLYVVGIYGAVIGSIGCYSVTAILDLISVRRRVPLKLNAKKAFVPILATAAFLAVGITTLKFLPVSSPLLLMLSSVPLAVIAFLLVIFLFKWFEVWEIKRILPL